MKKRSFLIALLTLGTSLLGSLDQPVQAVTVNDCAGEIPNNDTCLTEPTSYKIDTYRVDICQRDPFPSTRSSANYADAGCMTLFNGKGDLYRGQLANNAQYTLPTTGREIKPGTYKYLTMVINNAFISSGKYTSGGTTWRTLGPEEDDLSTTAGDPVEFSVKLSSWRGSADNDNPYCDNDGGTASRCEVNYNGYSLTGIGLGSNFVATSGDGVKYMFYMAELATPITLKADSEGYFDITVDNGLEVYGDGTTIQTIAVAPFIFQATFSNK